MAGVNRIVILGNLGRDPEVRFAQSGTAVCSFTVAVSERKKGEDGAWREDVQWFRVKSFGKTAENAGQYLSKGKQVYVEGRLEVGKYKDKDGQERTSVDVIAHSVVFLGGGAGKAEKVEPASAPAAAGFVDDNLPF